MLYMIWNNFKTTTLMAGLIGLFMALGYLLGGSQAILPALLLGGAMNVMMYFYSDKLALATMRARPITREQDPQLWDTVAELAQRARLPMPKVCVSGAQAPNAFATGRNPQHGVVCVTQGLRNMLSPDELAGVIAHELSHIKHRDILISTVVAVVAGAITYLSYLALFFGGRGSRRSPLVPILMMIFAPMAAGIIRMAISRSREFEADRAAAALMGTGAPLASSLRKLDSAARRIPLPVPEAQSNMFIVQPLTGKNMAKLFMTHPPTAERIARLTQM